MRFRRSRNPTRVRARVCRRIIAAAILCCGAACGAPTARAADASIQASCDRPGRVLEVGPGKSLAVPSAAAAVARSGDVVRITAGDYRGDVATWTASHLAICGVGGRARLFADGRSAQDKALWVIAGSDVEIDGIEFHGVKVPHRNGAGIRAEHGGNLAIRNSGFFDNENGILGGHAGSTVTIERSEFARNGYGDGYSHNLYIGDVDRLTVTDSFFHEAKVGHNLKSRARETRLENSYLMDGPTGSASYLADFPNGGIVHLRGNLFHKGPNAENETAIAYGAEGLKWPENTFEMVHNTVVSTYRGGWFLFVAGGTASTRLTANWLASAGRTELLTGGFERSRIVQAHNVVSTAADLQGASRIESPRFWSDGALPKKMQLDTVADPTYRHDAPLPFRRRPLTGSVRIAGALQSAP
jgi:hypothetical protein